MCSRISRRIFSCREVSSRTAFMNRLRNTVIIYSYDHPSTCISCAARERVVRLLAAPDTISSIGFGRDSGYNTKLCFGRVRGSKNSVKRDGRFAHFLFVALISMDLQALLDTTLAGLGYELVDLERSGKKGRLLRVFIDKTGGVNVDDCADVSRHLDRVLAVEGIAYDRLEVSSPGTDRALRKERDFVRFSGSKARIRLRVPVDGQRNFVGVLRETRAGKVQIETGDRLLVLDLDNLEKARLIPG